MSPASKNPQDPDNPENQVDPRWAQQTDQFIKALAHGIASQITPGTVSVAAQAQPQDRENWTTKEEALRYDELLDKDFVEIHPATKKIVDPNALYRVLQWHPQYQTVNQDEFKAKLFVEKWERQKDANGVITRKIITSFQVLAKEFEKNHQLTIAGMAEEDFHR